MDYPLVSILLPTYNRAHLLTEAINSVLNQTYQNWELILWDDGSADSTREVVNSFSSDSRLIYCFEENHGKSYALNRSLNLSKGKYIAFLDDDDQWDREKLDIQVHILEEFSEIDLIFSNYYNINLTSGSRGLAFDEYKTQFGHYKLQGLNNELHLVVSAIPEQLIVKNIVLPSTAMVRTSSCKKVGYFNEKLRNAEDLEYWWRMGLHGIQFAYLDRVLVTRIKPPKSLSSGSPLTYSNHITALDFCSGYATKLGRNDLIPYLRLGYKISYRRLIKSYVSQKKRMEAVRAYKRSLKYGFSFRTLLLLVYSLANSYLSARNSLTTA